MNHLIKLTVLGLGILYLSGCSTTLEDSQNAKKTVADLYQSDNQTRTSAHRALGVNSGFVRDSQNELENRFPMLPNPTLNMFVYPHLVGNSHPIPGYTSNFKLYQVDQYALPSEVY